MFAFVVLMRLVGLPYLNDQANQNVSLRILYYEEEALTGLVLGRVH